MKISETVKRDLFSLHYLPLAHKNPAQGQEESQNIVSGKVFRLVLWRLILAHLIASLLSSKAVPEQSSAALYGHAKQ